MPALEDTSARTSSEDRIKNLQSRIQELEKERNLYRAVFEIPDRGSFISTFDGKVIDVNQGNFGYRIDEIKQLNVTDLYSDPEQRKELQSLLKEQGQVNDFAITVKNKDTTLSNCKLSARLLKLNGTTYLIGTLTDITVLSQTERRLEQSRKKYELLFNTMMDGYALHEIICDESGNPIDYRFLDVNPAWELATGLSYDQVIGKTVMTVLPQTEAHWIDTYGKVALTGEIVRFENYSESVGGKWFEVLAFSPEKMQFAVIFHDITRRKTIEAELRNHKENLEDIVNSRTTELQEANEQLKILTELKNEFVTNVSHELRTPITSLKLHHHLIKANPDETETYVEHIGRDIQRLNTLIDNMLDVASLAHNEMKFLFKSSDISLIIAEYVGDRKKLAESKEIVLEADLGISLPAIILDRMLIAQVLGILLTNALNYTPKGGMISVSLLDDMHNGSRHIGFQVQDSGPGVASSEVDAIFDRFYRGEAAQNGFIPGTGLGLSIARQIVERHYGFITVSPSDIAKTGASFSVWLPLDSPLQRGKSV